MKKRLTTHTSTFHLHPPAHLPCLKDFPPPSRLFLSFLSTRSHSSAQKQRGQSPLSEVATATSVAPERGGAQGSFALGHGPHNGASLPPVSELDCESARLLRKAHETAFFPWFRNGLLASGIGHQGYLLHAE